jgi:DNA-binding CsgD family transcriptional regulator
VTANATFNLEEEIVQIKQLENSLPSSIGLYLLDLHSLTYAYMSQRSVNITGIDPKSYEQLGLNHFFAQLHPEDRQLIANKTLPLYKKMLKECSVEERKLLNASLNYRIKSENSEDPSYRHVLAQLSIRSVNQLGMPVLLLGVFSQLSLDQYLGQDFKLYLSENGVTTKILLDEHLSSNPLTDKEVEVLRYLAQGLSSKQIAEMTFTSKHTVDTHRRKVLKKLAVSNSIEAVIYCRSVGWI